MVIYEYGCRYISLLLIINLVLAEIFNVFELKHFEIDRFHLQRFDAIYFQFRFKPHDLSLFEI